MTLLLRGNYKRVENVRETAPKEVSLEAAAEDRQRGLRVQTFLKPRDKVRRNTGEDCVAVI